MFNALASIKLSNWMVVQGFIEIDCFRSTILILDVNVASELYVQLAWVHIYQTIVIITVVLFYPKGELQPSNVIENNYRSTICLLHTIEWCVCVFLYCKRRVEAWERGYVCVASFPGLHPSFCHLQYEKRRDISVLFVLQVTKAGMEAWEQGCVCVGS